ncbi:MAG: porin family protein [bacterium]
MKRAMSIVLAAALLLGVNGKASAIGGLEVGIKGGVNFANQTVDPKDAQLADMRTGLALGGFVGLPVLPNLMIQPEALFMMKGDQGQSGGIDGTYKLNYIEVPVLAKLGFMSQSPAHPSLFVGPSVSINTTAQTAVSDITTDVKDQTKPVDVGLVVGGGVDFQKLGIEARYTRGFTNVNDASGSTTDVKNSVISIMGTLRFL